MPLGSKKVSIAKVLGPSCTEIIPRYDEVPGYARSVVGYHELSQLVGRRIECLSCLLDPVRTSTETDVTWIAVSIQTTCLETPACVPCGGANNGDEKTAGVRKLPMLRLVYEEGTSELGNNPSMFYARLERSLNGDAAVVWPRLLAEDPSLQWHHDSGGHMSFVELEKKWPWNE
ncbi:hypothetical protein IAR50_004825 [Cryptococcus sp. DSM 104548]